MRVLVFSALVAVGLFGCKEKKSSSNSSGLVQGAAPAQQTQNAASPNAALDPAAAPADNPMNVQAQVTERQTIRDAQEKGLLDANGQPKIDPNLTKTTDASGKEVYYRKQAAPSAAPSATEVQSKLVRVPVSSLAPPSASRVEFFTKQNFYFAMAARSSEPGIFEKQYKDKWLVFKADQNFEIYQKSNLVGTGRWTFRESDSNLFLSCDDPYINNSWKFQNMPAAALLLGNTDLNKTGIQARLFMSDEKPH